MQCSILHKCARTKSKSCLNVSVGQRLFGFSTAFSLIYGEQPHYISSALYKHQINRCKNVQQSSTRPNIKFFNDFSFWCRTRLPCSQY
nr:hypothetical protein [Thalassotalea piscium]